MVKHDHSLTNIIFDIAFVDFNLVSFVFNFKISCSLIFMRAKHY